ncbi:MAG: T9SS type A sorting domain-containing protein [Saprospiraceae bacterium]|nr:T9SS type A sorting domain-containing protein [Saprospiraceae bacterium]
MHNIYEICAADAGSALLCVLKNGEHLFSNPDLDSCWYLPVAITEIAFSNISISPNPVERWLTISDPDQKVAEVSVSNLLGQLVYKGSELNINVDHIPQGFYLVSRFLKDGLVKTEKILRL